MRSTATYFRFLMLFTLAGCASNPPHPPVPTAPISYRSLQTDMERSVGRLRRLIIAPVRYECIAYSLQSLFGACLSAGTETDLFKDGLEFETIALLSDWKGYEAVPFGVYEDLFEKKLEISAEKIEREFNRLAAWATRLSPGEQPPAEIADTVSRLGRPLNVDGLVFIQSVNDDQLRADIFEVSTGKIVWRRLYNSRVRITAVSRKILATVLFDSLEPAIPKVLVEG